MQYLLIAVDNNSSVWVGIVEVDIFISLCGFWALKSGVELGIGIRELYL